MERVLLKSCPTKRVIRSCPLGLLHEKYVDLTVVVVCTRFVFDVECDILVLFILS